MESVTCILLENEINFISKVDSLKTRVPIIESSSIPDFIVKNINEEYSDYLISNLNKNKKCIYESFIQIKNKVDRINKYSNDLNNLDYDYLYEGYSYNFTNKVDTSILRDLVKIHDNRITNKKLLNSIRESLINVKDITDDTQFIKESVSYLTNNYTKEETYVSIEEMTNTVNESFNNVCNNTKNIITAIENLTDYVDLFSSDIHVLEAVSNISKIYEYYCGCELDILNEFLSNIYSNDNSSCELDMMIETVLMNKYFLLENEELILEADALSPDINRGKNKIPIIDKIIQALKRVYDIFRKKASDMSIRSGRFLKKFSEIQNDINYSALDLKIDPVYVNSSRLTEKFLNNELMRVLLNSSNYHKDAILSKFRFAKDEPITMDNFIKTDLVSKFVNKDGSLAGGAKNYFRYGNPNYVQRPKQLNDISVRKTIEVAFRYCQNYPTTIKELGNAQKQIENILKSVENKINSAQLESILNNNFLNDMKPIFEANNENKPEIDTSGSESKDDNASSNPKEKQPLQNLTSVEGQFIKCSAQCMQILLTAAMTITEERYNNYMNILKYASGSKIKTPEGDIIDKEKVDRTRKQDIDTEQDAEDVSLKKQTMFNKLKNKMSDKRQK